MKIAIITLPLKGNYGGILQNYALQTTLMRMGHTVETIVLPWQLKQPCWRMILSLGKRCLKKFILRQKTHIFLEYLHNKTQPQLLVNMWNFVRGNIIVRRINSFSDISEGDYDAFVVGSDQIWRPRYCCMPLKNAYLDFAKSWKNIKRVAYAASFGTDSWSYSILQRKKCSNLVQLFDGVSVREDSGVKLCKKYLHCHAVHVLDPTMLLKKEDYFKLFSGLMSIKSRGELLTYVLDETEEKKRMIQIISNYYHYSIYRANSQYEDTWAPLNERIQPPVEQWLKDFYDAKFIVTDSFHATVFSILFGKPFIVIGNKERGLARINSLLKAFNLENHLVHSLSELKLGSEYAFDSNCIESELQKLRKSSLDFLSQNLC